MLSWYSEYPACLQTPNPKVQMRKRSKLALLVQIRRRGMHNLAQLCTSTHENYEAKPKNEGSKATRPTAAPSRARMLNWSHPHALEQTVHSHAARQPRRSGGGQPSTAAARRIHPAGGGGNLQLPVSGAAVVVEDHPHRARRDGRHGRAGDAAAGAESGGVVAGIGAVGRDGRQHVPAEGPLSARPVSGHDTRGSDYGHGARRAAQLQAIAANLVSDPDQVSR